MINKPFMEFSKEQQPRSPEQEKFDSLATAEKQSFENLKTPIARIVAGMAYKGTLRILKDDEQDF